jgi:hypothetical protein
MADSRPSPRSVSRFAWRVSLLLLAFVLIAWGAYEIDRRVRIGPAREAWAALLADMRACGEPTSLADLPSEVPEGKVEYSDWLRGFQAAFDSSSFTSSGFILPSAALRLTARMRYTVPPGATITLDPSETDAWKVWERFQAHGSKWNVFAAEQSSLASLQQLRADEAKVFDELIKLDAVGGVDARRWLEAMLPSGNPELHSPMTMFTAAKMLALDAFLVREADDGAALELSVRRLLHLAGFAEAAPTLIQNVGSVAALEVLCDVLEEAKDGLAPEFMEKEVEPALAAFEPRTSLVQDMHAEALLFLGWFDRTAELLAPGGEPTLPSSERLDPSMLQLGRGVIERQREIASAYEMPYSRGRPTLDALAAHIPAYGRTLFTPAFMGTSVGGGSLSAVFAGDFTTRYEEACRIEVRVLFTRIRLLAQREDLEAARAFAARSSDPYDGNPLHERFEADGALRIWSVGPDGIDQTSAGSKGSDDVELVLDRKE